MTFKQKSKKIWKPRALPPEDVYDPENDKSIRITNLVKQFDDIVALDGIDLEIERGELFGLLGPNGAGKTTMISILCGLLSPSSGTAYVLGYDAKDASNNMKRYIGLCPQEPAYIEYLTGRENIEFFGNLHIMPKKELKTRTNLLLEKLGMVDSADRKAGKYSGGMIRRISTAIALIHDPEVAILDEPTVAMDPQSRHAVWEFIKDLKNRGKTVILTTHYIEEAEELCDRVGIIDQGKLIELGSPKELTEKYNCKNLEDVFIKLTGRKIREVD
ncbi:MAG: ABC transporter ATP-binding protein [archaeon]|nr:ABC transporter ATP-binding protein [archaeon]